MRMIARAPNAAQRLAFAKQMISSLGAVARSASLTATIKNCVETVDNNFHSFYYENRAAAQAAADLDQQKMAEWRMRKDAQKGPAPDGTQLALHNTQKASVTMFKHISDTDLAELVAAAEAVGLESEAAVVADVKTADNGETWTNADVQSNFIRLRGALITITTVLGSA